MGPALRRTGAVPLRMGGHNGHGRRFMACKILEVDTRRERAPNMNGKKASTPRWVLRGSPTSTDVLHDAHVADFA
eukprot:scaffold194590_cov30-Tisochrysis_lutea.AAC.2